MTTEKYGKVIKGLGGLYEVRIDEGGEIILLACRAKGILKRDEEKVRVKFSMSEIDLDEMLLYLINTYHIKDFKIEDISIEDITKELYEKNE